MTPLKAKTALDVFYLEARCKALDLAAIFDRIDRGEEASGVEKDPRLAKLRQALTELLGPAEGRAERVQQIFSDEYDPKWEKPKPRF